MWMKATLLALSNDRHSTRGCQPKNAMVSVTCNRNSVRKSQKIPAIFLSVSGARIVNKLT